MIVLTVGNSSSHISGLNPQQHNELKELLSYRITSDQITYGKGRYGAHKRTLLGRRGDFPTGLIPYVETWLKGNKHEVKDTRVAPRAKLPIEEITPIFEHAPYIEQLAAAEACKKYSRGIICAPTGVGKSYIAAIIIAILAVRTLVVVPSLELKRQLIKALRRIFPKADVGGFGSDIAVENVDALDLDPLTNYHCVVVDEFHHSGAKTYRKLNQKSWGGVYYRFGLTATPFRSQENERLLLESVLSQVIYRVEYKDAVDKGYIVPLEAYFIEVPKQPVKGHNWREVYTELVVKNDELNQQVKNVISALSLQNKSVLVLVKEIAHGERLAELTGAPFANGQDGRSEELIKDFNSKASGCLIATTGVCGEGVDTKPCEYVVIAGLGKSKNAFMQQVGRSFRVYSGKESAKVILFRNASHKWTRAHFRAQVSYLRDEYGVIPVKLELTG